MQQTVAAVALPRHKIGCYAQHATVLHCKIKKIACFPCMTILSLGIRPTERQLRAMTQCTDMYCDMLQVASLQSQVTGLQQTAFTQQAQLERLNQEALVLGDVSAKEQDGLRQTTQATEGNLQQAEQHR